MKTETKNKYQCKWCDYNSEWAGAITNHIKGNHPKQWKGSISATLGTPDTPEAKQRREKRERHLNRIKIGSRILAGTQTPESELKKKRIYNKRMRQRYLEQGLTSAGKKRKRSIAPYMIEKYSLNNGVHSEAGEHPAPAVLDWNSEAARAILVAAEIIKDVSVGMQIRSNQR